MSGEEALLRVIEASLGVDQVAGRFHPGDDARIRGVVAPVQVDGVQDALGGPVIERHRILAGQQLIGAQRGAGRVSRQRGVGDPDGVDDVENRGAHAGDHFPAGAAQAGVVPVTGVAVLHGQQAVEVFHGGGEMRAVPVMMFQDRHIDQLDVLAIGGAVPDAFAEFHPVAEPGGEAGVGDIFPFAIAVGGVVAGLDKPVAQGIEEDGRNRLAGEDGVHEIEEAVGPVVGVGLHGGVPLVGGARVAIQAAPALAVFHDHHLAREAVGVIEDPLDQAADDVAVGAAAMLPLGIDLDEDHVIFGDHAPRAAESGLGRGPVKFQAMGAHEAEEGVHAGVIVSAAAPPEGLIRDIPDPEQVAQRLRGGRGCEKRAGIEKGYGGRAGGSAQKVAPAKAEGDV